MTIDEFKASCGECSQPAYILRTDQDLLRKEICEFCMQQVPEAVRAFDWAVYDLKADPAPVAELVKHALTLPWMSATRWIYVRNAERGGTVLGEYLRNPSSRTTLMLELNGPVEGWPKLPEVSCEVDPRDWVKERFRRAGFTFEPGVPQRLVELAGSDLLRLESEVEKISLWAQQDRKVTMESVDALAIPGGERNVFELTEAMARGRRAEALRILNQVVEAGAAPLQLLSIIYSTMRRLLVAREMLARGIAPAEAIRQLNLWSYKRRPRDLAFFDRRFLLRKMLQIREADQLCKTTPTDPRTHLERLIVDTPKAGSV